MTTTTTTMMNRVVKTNRDRAEVVAQLAEWLLLAPDSLSLSAIKFVNPSTVQSFLNRTIALAYLPKQDY